MTAIRKLKTEIITFMPIKKPQKNRTPRNGLTKRGKFYHYCFEVNGERFTGSTKQEKKVDALKELERQRQKANHHAKGTPYTPLLSEIITEWETTQRADNHSEKHISNCSRLFDAHVYPITGDIRLDQFTEKHIEKIKLKYNEGHTEHGCNNLLTYIKCILRYGKKHYHIDVPEITKLKAQKKVIEYLDMEEIPIFLAEIDFVNRKPKVPNNPQISFSCRCMIFMGFRENEVINMTWKNYNPKNQTYTLNQNTKGGESPTVDVPDEVKVWIDRLPKKGNYLIHQEDGSKHKEGYTSNPIRRASKRMGRNFGPHVLRKTHGCLLAMVGTEAFTIQKTLRHKSIFTSQLYVDVANKVVSKAQGKMMDTLRQQSISNNQTKK